MRTNKKNNSLRHSAGIVQILLLLFLFASCSKQVTQRASASLTIVNAVVGSGLLVTNFSGTQPISWYLNANKLLYNAYYSNSYGTNNQFNSYSGINNLTLYQYPDTGKGSTPLFDLSLNLPAGSINSLFLTGTVASPDTLLVSDHIPYYQWPDSVTGIRFVNLSPTSAPVSVNIEGQPAGSEVAGLAYKGITGFKKYPASSAISSYTFEFRDRSTGALLTTYTADGINNDGLDPNNPVNDWHSRSHTLALLGLPDGTGNSVQTVLLINNY